MVQRIDMLFRKSPVFLGVSAVIFFAVASVLVVPKFSTETVSAAACTPQQVASQNTANCDCSVQQVTSNNNGLSPCIGATPGNANTVTTTAKANDLVANYINPFIDFLSGAIGLVVTISIVVAGIQYASSADDPQRVAAAKQRIANSVMALLAFIFLWAFLQWLIPGGLLNGS